MALNTSFDELLLIDNINNGYLDDIQTGIYDDLPMRVPAGTPATVNPADLADPSGTSGLGQEPLGGGYTALEPNNGLGMQYPQPEVAARSPDVEAGQQAPVTQYNGFMPNMAPEMLLLPAPDRLFPEQAAVVMPPQQPTRPLAPPEAPGMLVFGWDVLPPDQLVEGPERYVAKNKVGKQKHPKRKREEGEPEPEPRPKPAPKNPKKPGATTGWKHARMNHREYCRDPYAGCHKNCEALVKFPEKHAKLSKTRLKKGLGRFPEHLQVELWQHLERDD